MVSPKQSAIYEFVRRYFLENGYAPTVAEIASALQLKSRSYVHRCLQALEEAGMIGIEPNRKRNISLSDELSMPGAFQELPIIGRIAAGSPIEAVEGDDSLNLAGSLFGANRYVLQVKGDSMIGDNICDGDYVICERKDSARDGQIVVALIDQQDASLKRLKRNGNGTVSLLPSNPNLEPMIYPAERVMVQGIYLGLIRLH
jgi:repressor LexA